MILGLDEKEVRRAVAAVRPAGEPLGADTLGEALARAAWSGIAEPGDSVAGLLVDVLGAAGALAAVLEDHDPAGLAREVAQATGEPLTTEAVRAAEERWRPRLVAADAVRFLTAAAARGVRLVLPDDPAWPPGLADLGPHGPMALWCLGDPSLLRAPLPIALVGARAATGYGEHVCAEAASGLADRGFAIVSGAAYGIDGMAHRAALAGGGATVAFLAGGVDRFYPSGHEALLARIAESGAVVSELPCGSSPTRWRFLHQKVDLYTLSLPRRRRLRRCAHLSAEGRRGLCLRRFGALASTRRARATEVPTPWPGAQSPLEGAPLDGTDGG
ncbi:DNA-processing protein DprA [Naasia sp. SYSU D00057]|uniref:DNA-processing protein DprA n=1 Tax=Naasia sp. SYSU D00057 TaxID=2817380 RepID=UPI001B30804B|nr:DNA-processing protein DprA [Naasia sp. SYSU D00057]